MRASGQKPWGWSWSILTLGHPGVARGNSTNFQDPRIQARILEISLRGPEPTDCSWICSWGPFLIHTLAPWRKRSMIWQTRSSFLSLRYVSSCSTLPDGRPYSCHVSSLVPSAALNSLSASHNMFSHHLTSIVQGVMKKIRISFQLQFHYHQSPNGLFFVSFIKYLCIYVFGYAVS